VLPDDPVGMAMADFVGELVGRAAVEVHYTPGCEPPATPRAEDGVILASASRPVPDGWCTTLTVRLDARMASLLATDTSPARQLEALPEAALRASEQFRSMVGSGSGVIVPSVRRALRDSVVVEFLSQRQDPALQRAEPPWLLADTLEYLIELSGTRVESKNITHGVVITDVLDDTPRLSVPYPAGLRRAKRSPLLFDGQRSVLIVDPSGRARTELQRHRLERLLPGSSRLSIDDSAFVDSGSLVAQATSRLGGIGFFLREDRSIWTFVDGRPLMVRRGEHWTAFPLWLATAVGKTIGGGHAVDMVVQAALMISVQPNGAILGIVESPDALDGMVSLKDRFDLRDQFDRSAMRPETRLHHLIDARDLDAPTLARLAALDGATVVDRDGRLLAYGAVLSSSDSQHEGARTAAARTLSRRALAVLKVSEDGEISVFRDGEVLATLLRSGSSEPD
jgi:DisA bacterial checkpoint controller nucleotide-binding